MAQASTSGPQQSTAGLSSLPRGLALSISRVLDGPDDGQGQTAAASSSASTSTLRPDNAVASTSSVQPSASINVDPEPPANLTQKLARQFESPYSLTSTSLDRTQAQQRAKLALLDDEIDGMLERLSDEQSQAKLSSSSQIQLSVRQLFHELDQIREKAASSETTVREITGDIRMLDTGKRNLVESMTLLRRLQMLESGASKLETLTAQRNFREAAQAVQATKALQTSFKTFMGVERVATVQRQMTESQQKLKMSAMEEYERFFLQEAGSSTSVSSTQLPDAALALDAIGGEAVVSLLDWYCGLQLREYRRIFRATDEAGQLDNVSRRFAWFRRVLKQHEEEHAGAFLEVWQVSKALTARFADMTRDDLKSVLLREKAKLQVNVLLEALQSTMDYESQAVKRYGGASFSDVVAANPRPIGASSVSTSQSSASGVKMPAPAAPRTETMSSAFEPYLGIFVEAQDKALSELMVTYRRQGANVQSPVDDAADVQQPDGQQQRGGHHTVLPSSTELFYFYRQTLEQGARLSRKELLRDLCLVFRRYLRIYADEVLRSSLLASRSTDAGSGGVFGRRSASTDARLNVQEISRWCLILNTSEYCANTCQQLESKLQERIHEQFRSEVTFEPERELFTALVAGAIQMLVREMELSMEPAWQKMMRRPWPQESSASGQGTGAMDGIGASGVPSPYIDELHSALEAVAIIVRQEVETKRYVRTFADKSVFLLSTKFLGNLLRLKDAFASSATSTGNGNNRVAEQLLVDVFALKNMLLELPQYSPTELAGTAGNSYTRLVERSLGKLECLLGLLVLPITPPSTDAASTSTPGEAFVREYARLIGDRSLSNFQKVLELKGVSGTSTTARGRVGAAASTHQQSTGDAHATTSQQLIDTFVTITGEMDPSQIAETSFLTTLEIDEGSSSAAFASSHAGILTPLPQLEFASSRDKTSIAGTSGLSIRTGAAGASDRTTSFRSPGSPDPSGAPGSSGGAAMRVFGAGGKFGSLFGGIRGDR